MQALLEAFRHHSQVRGGLMAAGLAYYGLLAFVPMLVVALTGLTLVWGEEWARREIAEWLAALFGQRRSQVLGREVLRLSASLATASIVSLVVTLYTQFRLFIHLQNALDSVFAGLPEKALNRGARVARRGIALASVGAVVVGLGGVTTFSVIIRRLGLGPNAEWSLHLVVWWAVLCGAAALAYRTLPRAALTWRECLWGGAITGGLVMAGGAAAWTWLEVAGHGSLAGALGASFAVLVWGFWCAQAVLLGASFTRALAHRPSR